MTATGLTNFNPMTPEEKKTFDEEKGVAKKREQGFVTPEGSVIAVADTGEETKLKTPETTLLKIAISYVEQGVPKDLAKGLVALALNAIQKGQSLAYAQERLKSTLEIIIDLVPESAKLETSLDSGTEVSPVPGAAMGTEAQRSARMWADLMQQRRESQKPKVIGGELTVETTPAQFPSHSGTGSGFQSPAQQAA